MLVLSSLALLGYANAAAIKTIVTTITTSSPPDYFQTTPEIFQGPTPTGKEPFLAETNPAPFSGVSYTPPSPLETQEPIKDNSKDKNIFQLLGNLSPYFPSPGFGVDEYPLPHGSEIVWLNMLSRHGSRYPTSRIHLGDAFVHSSPKPTFSGELSWLNNWRYSLGTNILTPNGRSELYDSGVLHNYLYGHLFEPNSTKKLLVRTTTEDRMRKSAENFMAGFFGLNYEKYSTIEFIIDETNFNNSLAGYNVCPNNEDYHTSAGANASAAWIDKYTKDAVKRFNSMTTGFKWTSDWVYNAQQLCSYETTALGYSKFCGLFTYQEWLDFEYSIDLDFIGTYGFLSPTARAVGVGYVEEVLARLNHHLIKEPTASDNVTLDGMRSTFPTNQVLNFDFTHEVNLFSILTAFSLKEFAKPFSPDHYTADRSVIVSHMVPFGCRLDIELIDTPHPVKADRSSSGDQYTSGGPTTYIHFKLNQRTIGLGNSLPECGKRDDGWCELNAFLKSQANALKEANYNYACNGNYKPPKWGEIDNGAPPSS